ncbi:hypothetical protein [Microbacterium terrisoli]|jgi:hypothetical protein|uniref:hypothetical protein n=1 Tax=Microbacterium terrisoli TaxID=3242192 RepID=UPI002805CA84|nr:hypothetical protein [Microbacterium protaetiae]
MAAVWILAGASLAVAVLMWLCAIGVIRRNPIVAIRIPSLFASDQAWQAGHHAALPVTIIGAMGAVATSIGALAVPWFARTAFVIQRAGHRGDAGRDRPRLARRRPSGLSTRARSERRRARASVRRCKTG